MDKVQSAVDITLSKYPGIGKDELVRLFTGYIETHLKDIVAMVELPSRVELKHRRFIEARKTKKFRMSEEELRGREAFIEQLEKIKSEGRERASAADFLIETGGWGRDDVMRLMEYHFASPEIEIGGDVYSKDFEDGLHLLSNHTYLEIFHKIEETTGIEKTRGETLDEMKERIFSIANEITNNKVEEIKQYYDEDLGFTIEIVVNQTDKDALETWLHLIDEIKPLELGIIIAVDWTEENVLSEDELVHRTVDVMLKLGIGPQRTDRFSAVKEIEGEWL